jgi:hypothetical protein
MFDDPNDFFDRECIVVSSRMTSTTGRSSIMYVFDLGLIGMVLQELVC